MILLAEDEAPIRDIARRALEAEGHTVLAAGDGLEALALSERHGDEIALVVADLVMPRLGGTDLRREAARLAPGARFLLTSGYGVGEASRGDARRAGETPLLPKPWTVGDLLARVRELLAG